MTSPPPAGRRRGQAWADRLFGWAARGAAILTLLLLLGILVSLFVGAWPAIEKYGLGFLTNQPGAESWPITGATFILIHKVQDKPAQAQAVLRFFEWAYKNGDKTAEDLDYVPMPAAVKAQVTKLWAAEIKDGSGKNVAFQ